MSEEKKVCKHCGKKVDTKSGEFIQLRRKDGLGEPFWICQKCYIDKGYKAGYPAQEVPL